MKKLTLSDFALKEVVRNGDKAEVIFDYFHGRPVRLIGFESSAWKKDYDILEESYFYWRDLLEFYGKPGANLY